MLSRFCKGRAKYAVKVTMQENSTPNIIQLVLFSSHENNANNGIVVNAVYLEIAEASGLYPNIAPDFLHLDFPLIITASLTRNGRCSRSLSFRGLGSVTILSKFFLAVTGQLPVINHLWVPEKTQSDCNRVSPCFHGSIAGISKPG